MNGIITYETAELLQKYLPDGRLDAYFDALMAENEKVNLVSRETTRDAFARLVCESLLPLKTLPDSFDKHLDIGSGGGFPAVPIALAGRVGEETTLVERTGKKAAALKSMCATLGIKARVIRQTFEEIKFTTRYDLITLRYVKLTPSLLKSIMGRLRTDGVFVYYSTPEFAPGKFQSMTVKFRSPESEVVKSFTLLKK